MPTGRSTRRQLPRASILADIVFFPLWRLVVRVIIKLNHYELKIVKKEQELVSLKNIIINIEIVTLKGER